MADTDILLALVSSLLTGPVPDTDTILDVLVKCNGDVEATAQLLNDRLKAKRRKLSNLDDWLQKDALKPSTSSDKPKDKTITTSRSVENSKSSTAVNLMSVLRDPASREKVVRLPQLRPLMLSNPIMVAQNTPCTLHPSVLPPQLACELFYTMIRAARGWQRSKWWLVDKLVESPHRSAFFARRNGCADASYQATDQYWYNGQPTDPPATFPPAMEEACNIIEKIVNEQIKQRKRFLLEWGGDSEIEKGTTWRANVAASNCYEGSKEGVGFHSDHMTYLGPYPTIASLSLGASRVFSLREVIPTDQTSVRKARTFNIPLPHNSLTIMHASCQEKFKHSIPLQPVIDLYRPAFPENPDDRRIEPSNCRINITFRFFRPDFRPSSIPLCKCGVPTILRADMKNRTDGNTDRYWWTCYAGAQNEGKGCNYWKVLDMKSEGRGPCIGDMESK